jgi:hypothetical protein
MLLQKQYSLPHESDKKKRNKENLAFLVTLIVVLNEDRFSKCTLLYKDDKKKKQYLCITS